MTMTMTDSVDDDGDDNVEDDDDDDDSVEDDDDDSVDDDDDHNVDHNDSVDDDGDDNVDDDDSVDGDGDDSVYDDDDDNVDDSFDDDGDNNVEDNDSVNDDNSVDDDNGVDDDDDDNNDNTCVVYFTGADSYNASSLVTGRESAYGSAPHLNCSLMTRVSHTAVAETSGRSSASSTDASDRTSSTAVRETDVQFLNDSAAVGTRPTASGVRRAPRVHRVNVTVPTDSKPDAVARKRAQAKSRVTFQSDAEPSANSVVGSSNAGVQAGAVDRLQTDNMPAADRGEQTFTTCIYVDLQYNSDLAVEKGRKEK